MYALKLYGQLEKKTSDHSQEIAIILFVGTT